MRLFRNRHAFLNPLANLLRLFRSTGPQGIRFAGPVGMQLAVGSIDEIEAVQNSRCCCLDLERHRSLETVK